MESCFRFSILEFVFGKYLYIFFPLFRLNDGQTLCERNVGDCFIATYGLPKSCVLCTWSGGLRGNWTSVKKRRGGERTWGEVSDRSAFYPPPPQRHPLNEGRSETEGVTDGEPKSYSRCFFPFFFFLDTQSSLKLTTVYAVLEDSHWGGPVLLERLKRRRHARTHKHKHRKHEGRKEERDNGVKCA